MKKPKVHPRKPPATSSSVGNPDAFVRGAPEKNERATVYLPPALLIRAQVEAVKRRVSFSALVAEALEATLPRDK
jgi:hypothetical protein